MEFKKSTHHAGEEAAGLRALAGINKIRFVKVLSVSGTSITLEKIKPEPPTAEFWRRFGRNLAAHHSVTHDYFGFELDNHIGATPQLNPKIPVAKITWADYFVEYRLRHMLKNPRLLSQKHLQETFARGEQRIKSTLEEVTEKPSLLHGDLWSGNFLCAEGQVPVLIDPAPYSGHREADLAMTELFGGFSAEFYQSYNQHLPLDPAYQRRKHIYNLYHLFNHWILFGAGYEGQALSTLERAITLK